MTQPELPTLSRVAGASFEQIKSALKPWDLRRVEADLAVLATRLSDQQLKKCYVRRLSSEGIGAIAELFAVARAASHADALLPHAPGHGSNTCDARLTFGTQDYALEVKHQRDQFPFNGVPRKIPDAGTIYEASRPGADVRVLDLPTPPGLTHKVPGSTIWRDALLEPAAQLPRDLPGIVALSVDAFGPELFDDLTDAVLGDRQVTRRPGGSMQEARLRNGAFALESFRHITSVWFFRLQPQPASIDPQDLVRMCLWARGCGNHGANLKNVPTLLEVSLPNVYDAPLRDSDSGDVDA